MGHPETQVDVEAVEIFRAPRISLIARPQFIEPEHLRVQWKGEASDGERIAEFAGRLCYMSQHNPINRTTAEYLENIKKQGHGSVLEHAVYVLLIEGISRSCSHELVRLAGREPTAIEAAMLETLRAGRSGGKSAIIRVATSWRARSRCSPASRRRVESAGKST